MLEKTDREELLEGEGKDAPSRLFNNSLAKAFSLLEAFGRDRRAMNLPEMAMAAGITKSAAQRLAHTLVSLGYLRKDPYARKYTLTARVVELGMRYTTTSPLIESANPYLLDLSIKCGETVNLSVPDGTDMVFVVSFPGHRQISVQLPVGGRYPIYCTAAGRAYLSGLPKEQADLLLRKCETHSYTPATITDPDELIERVDEARNAGFAYVNSEYFRGDINIAAPILGVEGVAVAAVGVSVPLTRWSFPEAYERLAPLVTELAQTVSSLFAPKRPTGL